MIIFVKAYCKCILTLSLWYVSKLNSTRLQKQWNLDFTYLSFTFNVGITLKKKWPNLKSKIYSIKCLNLHVIDSTLHMLLTKNYFAINFLLFPRNSYIHIFDVDFPQYFLKVISSFFWKVYFIRIYFCIGSLVTL